MALALEMIGEITAPQGWGVLEHAAAAGGGRPLVAADAGYIENTTFRCELSGRGWRYAVAVKGAASAHPSDAVPEMMAYGGRPSVPRYRAAPVSLRALALAYAAAIQREDLQAPMGARRRSLS